MMREKRMSRRRGMTMVELLGVMVVIAILAAIAIGGVTSAQKRARDTTAVQALSGYRDAFTTVCTTSPGLIGDRANSWVDATSYTSEHGLKKVVSKMNELLDDELMMYWDNELKCYKSQGFDPWGGHYILTEYPMSSDGSVNYYDPTAGGKGVMALSVWATGNSDGVLSAVINDDSKGIALSYISGLVDAKFQGVQETVQLSGWLLKLQ